MSPHLVISSLVISLPLMFYLSLPLSLLRFVLSASSHSSPQFIFHPSARFLFLNLTLVIPIRQGLAILHISICTQDPLNTYVSGHTTWSLMEKKWILRSNTLEKYRVEQSIVSFSTSNSLWYSKNTMWISKSELRYEVLPKFICIIFFQKFSTSWGTLHYTFEILIYSIMTQF